MSSSPPNAATGMAPRTWRGALRLFAGSALFWALTAAVLFIAAPGLDTFGRLLVFNECVGMAMVAFAMLLRPSRWLPRLSPRIGWLVTGAVAIPAGYVVGHVLAFIVLREPFRIMSPGNDRMVPIVFTVLIAGFGLHYFATRERLANEAAARSEAQRLTGAPNRCSSSSRLTTSSPSRLSTALPPTTCSSRPPPTGCGRACRGSSGDWPSAPTCR